MLRQQTSFMNAAKNTAGGREQGHRIGLAQSSREWLGQFIRLLPKQPRIPRKRQREMKGQRSRTVLLNLLVA